MKNELSLQQKQQLSLTVMQKISLELLNRNQIELQEYLKEEASLNPFLEPVPVQDEVSLSEDEETSSGFDENWDIYAGSTSSHLPRDFNPDDLMESLSRPEDWTESLQRDIRLSRISEDKKTLLTDILDHLDENGFLSSPSDLMAKHALNEESFEEALALFFLLAPPGVGARTLEESYRLQLHARGLDDPLLEKIVTEKSDAVRRKDFHEALDGYDLDPGEARRVERILSSLMPRPLPEEDLPATAVLPDLFISRSEGEFRAEVSDKYLAYFTINPRYVEMMRSPDMGTAEKAFLKKYYQNYLMIKTALDRRRETLQKLGEALIQKQRPFFEKGFSHLRPLTQAEAAEIMDVHPSTVSRAVRDKFVQTEFGLFPLGIFFTGVTGTVSSTHGEQVSRTLILQAMKEMVDREDKSDPLTDEEIAGELEKKGYQVSRRAVNKYRGMIGIPSRKERRL